MYRTFVVWNYDRWVMVLPLGLLLSSWGTSYSSVQFTFIHAARRSCWDLVLLDGGTNSGGAAYGRYRGTSHRPDALLLHPHICSQHTLRECVRLAFSTEHSMVLTGTTSFDLLAGVEHLVSHGSTHPRQGVHFTRYFCGC